MYVMYVCGFEARCWGNVGLLVALYTILSTICRSCVHDALDNVSLSARARSEGSGGRRLLNEFLTWIGGSRTWTWPFVVCFLPVSVCLCQLGIRIPRTGSNAFFLQAHDQAHGLHRRSISNSTTGDSVSL